MWYKKSTQQFGELKLRSGQYYLPRRHLLLTPFLLPTQVPIHHTDSPSATNPTYPANTDTIMSILRASPTSTQNSYKLVQAAPSGVTDVKTG